MTLSSLSLKTSYLPIHPYKRWAEALVVSEATFPAAYLHSPLPPKSQEYSLKFSFTPLFSILFPFIDPEIKLEFLAPIREPVETVRIH